jgi:membrane protein insertase Oxa1/YidC/SpoIIIJ
MGVPGDRIGIIAPPARLSRTEGVPTRTCPVSNLTIANIFLFFAILCMTLSFSAGLLLYFVYSIAATAMAGAVRYQQLPEKTRRARRH